MPDYTIETSYRVPAFRHRTYQADTAALACRQAIEDDEWSGEKLSYEDAGETYVSGIWSGADAAYSGPAIPVPSHFSETRERKVRHFEILLGLLKLLLADVQAGRVPRDDWIERAVSAVARCEAILAGARDPDELAEGERL
ncbi:hypothetical protein PX860_27415 (plasmid) [Agrobacterium leguminum]|uniref:hypothetical protein n=1 Tax=Agrobacterium leguminum TaxID=2792015 RepID=UPI00272CF744|nr:hypothetical protein [Agrobacterium leguminum]WLE00862.1 hypothetical protein PX860_27415 [Agrobacterium leguminum]